MRRQKSTIFFYQHILVVLAFTLITVIRISPLWAQDGIVDIGFRRELFVDDFLIASFDGAELMLHNPLPREVVLTCDEPWEGTACGYMTVFRDQDRYRMYYKSYDTDITSGEKINSHELFVAYAESENGIDWIKPNLGLFEFDGSRNNNIVWKGNGCHGFTPFIDGNPECPTEAKYKAVGAKRKAVRNGLFGLQSPDGIHWSLIQHKPIIQDGDFDSQNLAIWDSLHSIYRVYFRERREGNRSIRTAVSDDFIHWSDAKWLEFSGEPIEQLYTNQIESYYRAPHIFIGFPTRYIDRREWSLSMDWLPQLQERRIRYQIKKRYGTALTEGLFMTSRDGRIFKCWREAFTRPGVERSGQWIYGAGYQSHGMFETPSALPGAPPELSFFVTENSWHGNGTKFRRYTIRVDGFVSVHASMQGGEFTTKPLTFEGNLLDLNFSTSAAGGILVEIQDAGGIPIEGFTIQDCYEIFGDNVSRPVVWKGDGDLNNLVGIPVRLRFVLRDADLYSFCFKKE
jgi:hypothetical protein